MRVYLVCLILSPHSKVTILFGNFVGARFRLLQYQFVAIYEFDKAFVNSIGVSFHYYIKLL
jgi:hypothetical protein